MNTPPVYKFIDFKEFLQEYYVARKTNDRKFTQSYICRQMGLPNTRSYFRDIVNGKTPLSSSKIETIIRLFNLQDNEAQYFKYLVQYNQTTIPSEKDFCLEQLIILNNTPYKIIEPEKFKLYRHWLPSVVRAALDVFDVKDDISILRENIIPSTSMKKINDAFLLLKKLKLVVLRNGFWKPSDISIHAGSYLQDELIKRYQVECSEMGKNAIFSSSEKPHNFSSHTVSISKDAYKKIEKRLQKFKSEMRAIIHKDEKKASDVYQLNIQLFPHTK